MKFHLVRYFTIASIGMIALVAGALIYFERDQGRFFTSVQERQIGFVGDIQRDFAKQQDEAAKRDLLAIHESGNVNLTRLFANALWERDFAPFVAKAQAISFAHCHAMPDEQDKEGKTVVPPAKKACFTEAGKQIVGIPGFKALDAKVYDAMQKSTVFKIKVFDMRGITVYSSEHKQIGEDKSTNAGWKGASEGKVKSELTHRDKFSAFEGVVENRDLISSYLPVYLPGTQTIVGVFEVYSDVTPFLAQINETSGKISRIAKQNQERVREEAALAQEEVASSSTRALIITTVLMLALFGALLAIVRRADALIKAQASEREQMQQQLTQAEKMASLGQMVAGVAHQLNTPLAFSQSNVQMVQASIKSLELPMGVARTMTQILRQAQGDQVVLNIRAAKANLQALEEADVDLTMLHQMLGDTLEGIAQMSELVANLRDFTRLDQAKLVEADLNKALHTVVYIAKSVIANDIEVREEFAELPVVECNVSQLNQVFLNLINNAAQAISGPGVITVRSELKEGRVEISVQDTGSGIPEDVLPKIFDPYFTTKPIGEGTGLGLPIARDIAREHGGDLAVVSQVGKGTTFTVTVPLRQSAA